MKKLRKSYSLILFFCCISAIMIVVGFLRLKNRPKEISKEELQVREEIRKARLEELLPQYFWDTSLGQYSRIDWLGTDDRFLQNCCAGADFCAVVKVTKGLEEMIEDGALVEKYNYIYGTEEELLTKEQKQKLLTEYPKFLSVNQGGLVELEIEEYLFRKTEDTIQTITMELEKPYAQFFSVCTGMRLVCFFRKSLTDASDGYVSGDYLCGTDWAYYLTAEDYLVPMSIDTYEDMVRYGGLSLQEYKEQIAEKYDCSEKRWAILTYFFENIVERDPEYSLKGNYLILDEKSKGKKLELALLAVARKSGREKTRYGEMNVTKTEDGLLFLSLKKQGGHYVVEDGCWDWNGQEEKKLPEEVRELAKKCGYPDGDYMEQIGEERWYTNAEIVERYRQRYP